MPERSPVAAALARATAALPAGEARPGQVTMAEAVGVAIAEKRPLLVQAGTGTGKSLAYLVPAILGHRRTVVATATKALQDQLADRDLPFLAEHLGVPFEFAVLKGRSNYACRQRLAELDRGGDAQLSLDGMSAGASPEELASLAAWAQDSSTGDRAELEVEPSAAAWAAISVGARECPGRSRCPKGGVCFTELARDRAAEADVIVVNQHLYGMHLATDGAVLPEHDVLIVDEAHQLEDVLSATVGVELSAGRCAHLARTVAAIVDDPALVEDLELVGDRIRDALRPLLGTRLRRPDAELQDAMAAGTERVNRALEALRRIDTTDPDASARKERAMQAAGALGEDLLRSLEVAESEVAWVEGDEDRPVLRVAPLEVARVLDEHLWGGPAVVLTSATLPDAIAESLGVPEAHREVLDVGSPFDYEHQAVLYCATHLPEPRDPRWEERAIDELASLIHAAGGRTLALFTSWRMMRAAADALRGEIPGRLLRQDDLPKPALLRTFTEDATSSLFATMGFWQGIDVPGPSLTLVTIDKLPFPRPDDPLLSARRERAREAAFRTIDLPRATVLLAQGAGRLIRTATDRGVVAVLDSRLASAGYRWDLIGGLPPMRRTKDRAEVLALLSDLHTRAM